MPKTKKRRDGGSWLDPIVGWEPEGSVIETCWVGDPAIDQELSDCEAYSEDLDRSHLAVRPGCEPERMIVRLPTAAQWGQIRPHLTEVGHETAAVVAFELCVRFPDLEGDAREPGPARPAFNLGFRRLPQPFLRVVLKRAPDMIPMIGLWLINSYMLTDDEKKTSSRESTKKISSPPASTPAEGRTGSSPAPSVSAGSTAAPTSATTPGPLPESSGSAVAAPSTSGTPSTAAPAPTSGAAATGSGNAP